MGQARDDWGYATRLPKRWADEAARSPQRVVVLPSHHGKPGKGTRTEAAEHTGSRGGKEGDVAHLFQF